MRPQGAELRRQRLWSSKQQGLAREQPGRPEPRTELGGGWEESEQVGRTRNPEERGTHPCKFSPRRHHLLTVTIWVSQLPLATLVSPLVVRVSVIPLPRGICSLSSITPVKVLV